MKDVSLNRDRCEQHERQQVRRIKTNESRPVKVPSLLGARSRRQVPVSQDEARENEEKSNRTRSLVDHISHDGRNALVMIDSRCVVENHHGERSEESKTVQRRKDFRFSRFG